MTLQEIRQKYPQYGDMSDSDLAKALHRKYYSDMDYSEFSSKMGVAEKPKEEYDPFTVENIAGSAVEPLLTLGSGIVAAPVAGIAGLADLATGGDSQSATDTINSIAGALTYAPKTGGGKIATDVITSPFQWMHKMSEKQGKRVLDATGSPAAAAATSTALQAIPMFAGGRAINGKPVSPKLAPVEEAIANGLKYPFKKTGQGLNAVIEALAARFLPDGAEKASIRAVNKMVGPRLQAIIAALEKAKPGETAGQAAVDVGSLEFSALQKMAQQRKPSDYYAIHEAQQSARMDALRDIAKTPEQLRAAEALRSAAADPLYKTARTGNVQGVNAIVSKIDKIMAENPGNAALLNELRTVRKGLVDNKGNVRADAQQVLSTVDHLKGAIANKDYGHIKGNLTQIKNDIIDLSPSYGTAQKVFADHSKPINRMQIGEALVDSISPRIGAKDRVASFGAARANAPNLIKRATGNNRYKKIEEALTDREMQNVNRVHNELNRDAKLRDQASQGNKAMNEHMGTMFDLPRPGILERTVVILNTILKRLEGKNTARGLDYIAEKMQTPKEMAREMARLMKEATPQELAVLNEYMNTIQQTATGAAIGAAENRNGL